MIETAVAPQGVEAGVCRACQAPVWIATTLTGAQVSLDVEPREEGTIELRRAGSSWFAETLAQTECLFHVDWPRWTPHRVSCSGAPVRRRGSVPEPRRG